MGDLQPKANTLTPADFQSRFDTFLFDADGVLWRDQQAIEGAAQLLGELCATGKRVVVVSNNATRTREQYADKFARLGFRGLDASSVVTSGMVLADRLAAMQATSDSGAPIYLFASEGLRRCLEAEGIRSIGVGPDPVPVDQTEFLTGVPHPDPYCAEQRPFAIVAGYDVHMTAVKVQRALNWLRDPKMPFLVTNEDATFPGQNGQLHPGAGMVTSCLRYVSGREPEVMGKPSKFCWQFIDKKYGPGLDKQRTVMIGDRLETDIKFGNDNGLTTLLVLTGVHGIADVERYAREGRADLVPRFIVPSLRDLLTPR